ncbi:hypothetical protein SBADM41S_07834 [Streptomyces badius]
MPSLGSRGSVAAPSWRGAEDSRTVRYPSASVTFTWSARTSGGSCLADAPWPQAQGETDRAGTVVVQDVDVRGVWTSATGRGTTLPFTEPAGDAVVLGHNTISGGHYNGPVIMAQWVNDGAPATPRRGPGAA